MEAYWALYHSALYIFVKLIEGIVISYLACRMSCSPTPVPQRKTGGGKLYKDNRWQNSEVKSVPKNQSYHSIPTYTLTQLTNIASSQVSYVIFILCKLPPSSGSVARGKG